MDSILKSVMIAAILFCAQQTYAAGNCSVTSEPIFKKYLAYDALMFLNNLGISMSHPENKETTIDSFERSDLFGRPSTILIGSKNMGSYLYEAEIVSLPLVKEFTQTFPDVERRAFVYRVEFISRPNAFSEKCTDTGKRGRRFIEQIENIRVID